MKKTENYPQEIYVQRVDAEEEGGWLSVSENAAGALEKVQEKRTVAVYRFAGLVDIESKVQLTVKPKKRK